MAGVAAQAQESTRITSNYQNSETADASILNGNRSAPQFRVFLPEPQQPQLGGNPLQSSIDKKLLDSGLTQGQAKKLADHDVILLVDKSWSMGTNDCHVPHFMTGKLGSFLNLAASQSDDRISRWDWCLAQTTQMAKQTERVLLQGFSVILFDGRYSIYPHVNAKQLKKIFSDNNPGGSTKLEGPLSATFSDYFQRMQSGGKTKPLVVGIITDGCPTHPEEVRETIASATHRMKNPDEITIVFFMVGEHDRKGEEFVYRASHDLQDDGARFNIVKSVSFIDLERSGLARALADNLR
jgi:Mg-chelatase subunit ChlD